LSTPRNILKRVSEGTRNKRIPGSGKSNIEKNANHEWVLKPLCSEVFDIPPSKERLSFIGCAPQSFPHGSLRMSKPRLLFTWPWNLNGMIWMPGNYKKKKQVK
jgi:hypothetical protein